MRSALATQRDELQDLRSEVEQLGSTLGGFLGSAGKALAQIRNEKEELERQNALLKESLADRCRPGWQDIESMPLACPLASACTLRGG